MGYLKPPLLVRIASKSLPLVPKLKYILLADSLYSMAVAALPSPNNGRDSLSNGEHNNEEVSPLSKIALLILPELTRLDITANPFTQPEHPWLMSIVIQSSDKPSLSCKIQAVGGSG